MRPLLNDRTVGSNVAVTAGHSASPVLLHVPHSSRAIPAHVRNGITLTDRDLRSELDILTDTDTDLLAMTAAQLAAVTPATAVNAFSRLVIDPERFPDDLEPMAAKGMAAVYTHGHDGRRLRETDPHTINTLMDRYYTPYAETVQHAVEGLIHTHQHATIIDIHSYPTRAYPFELHPTDPRPQVCIGTDPFHTPEWMMNAARDCFAAFSYGINTPFTGCYVPLAMYGSDPTVTSVMIEIRRDVYLDQELNILPDGFTALTRSLAALIDTITATAGC